MTKKQEKERNKRNRTLATFNTGTRVHQNKKHPSRAKQKCKFQKETCISFFQKGIDK